MITFNFEDAIRLRSDTVSNVAIDSVFCVVFVGGNPGGTEGDIYLFSLDNGKIELYIGNTYRSISYDRLFDAVPITKKLYNSNRNGQKVPGWKDFPYCMGHYVFVLDFMAELLVENLKNGDKSRGLHPLAEGVVCTACQCEEALLSRLSNGSFWKLSEIQGIGVDGATEIEGKIEKLGLKLTEAPPLEVKGTDSEILSVIATYCNRKKICTAEFSKDKSIASLHYRDWFNSKKRAIRDGRNTDEFTDAVLNTNFDFGVKPLYRREWEAMADQYFSENGKDDMPLDYDEGPYHLGLWAAKNLLKVNGNFGTVDTISLVYQDKTYTIQSFSNQFGIESEVIIARLKKGWDPEEIREGEKKKIEYHGHRFWTIHDMARFYKVNPLSFEIGQAAEVHYNEIMDILLEINRTHIINKELYEKRYKGRINYYPVITLPYLCNHLEAQPQIVKLVKDTVRKVGSCIKNRCYTLTFTPQSYHSLFIGNEVTEKEVLKALYFIVDQAKEILKTNGK